MNPTDSRWGEGQGFLSHTKEVVKSSQRPLRLCRAITANLGRGGTFEIGASGPKASLVQAFTRTSLSSHETPANGTLVAELCRQILPLVQKKLPVDSIRMEGGRPPGWKWREAVRCPPGTRNVPSLSGLMSNQALYCYSIVTPHRISLHDKRRPVSCWLPAVLFCAVLCHASPSLGTCNLQTPDTFTLGVLVRGRPNIILHI